MFRHMQMDLKRAVFSYKTFLALFGITATWLLNSARFSNSEDILFLFVYTKGLTVTTYLALTISNVAYGTSICEDYSHNAISLIVIRSSVKKYVLSKILVCNVVTLVIYILGTLLFILVKAFELPLTAVESTMVSNIQSTSCFAFFLPEHPLLLIFFQCILDGLCCSIMAVAALSISTFVPNAFIALCMPVVLFFLQEFLIRDIINIPFNFEGVFMACFTNANIGFFMIRVISLFLIYNMGFGVLMYRQVKRRLTFA